MRQVQSTLQQYFPRLKHIFINLMSSDNYPHIGWNDFTAFTRLTQVLDDTIPTSTIDRMFLAAKAGTPQGLPQQLLFRHEFLEVLCRIARAKFCETGRADNINDALNILLEGIVKNYETKPWQDFRQEVLWSWGSHKIFVANDAGLKAIYEKLFPRFEARGLEACIDLFCEDSTVELSVKEVRFCFGMSKMTVRDEIQSREEYDKLRFVEFLEFIGRVAYTKYFEDEEMNLEAKIELILDAILPIFGFKRHDAGEQVEDENTSSESCIIDQAEVQVT